ncbi:unnamed protein product [Adineta steineri]|uniref:Uncharacterized protein n=1 Tax=Adineta steineri TaxID=433720 RepID=A0A815CN21_9BILA|nr:unnamed protein product [Adineta steineri]
MAAILKMDEFRSRDPKVLFESIAEANAYTRMTLGKELVTRCASRYVICMGMKTTVAIIENHLTSATTKLLVFATPLNVLTFSFFGAGESLGRLCAGTVQIDLNKEYSVTNLTQLNTQSVLAGVKKAASSVM